MLHQHDARPPPPRHAGRSEPERRPDEQLARLAAGVGPLRRVQAALAERLIASGAPARLGYARLRDYARERLGRSARQLQELAKGHRRLGELPALERALVGNALPWSKVRLVARVATPGDERTWLARAHGAPVRRLEEEVAAHLRAARGAAGAGAFEAAEEAGPETRLRIRCSPAVRERWAVVHEVAERVAGECLSAADALEHATAEALSELPLEPAAARWLEESEAAPASGARSDALASGPGGSEAGWHAEWHPRSAPDSEPAEPRDASPLEPASDDGADAPRGPHASSALDGHAKPPRQGSGLTPVRDGTAGTTELAPELPEPVATLADGLEEADAFELDRRLRQSVALEQTLEARMAPLLRVVACREYEWSGAPLGLERFAREELGVSASKARALVRLERAGDACPELRHAYRAGRLSWVKAQALLPLLLLDVDGVGGARWRPAWIAWAERVTVRRLEADVERALLLRAGTHLAFHRCLHHPERAQDPLPEAERQLCAHDVDPEATEELVFRVPVEVAALFRAVRETLRRRLWAERVRAEAGREGAKPGGAGSGASVPGPAAPPVRPPTDGEVFEAVLDRALRAWLQREPGKGRPDPVIERDGYRCVVPGCTSRRNLQDHHVVFRSRGGSDDPANRATLCAFHHQRGLHAGLLAIRGRAPDALVFELGLRPGAPPLARYRSGDVALRGAPEAVLAGARRVA